MNKRHQTKGTMLWLTGWSMPDAIFDRTREWLPDFRNYSADYSNADSPEEMMLLTEEAAKYKSDGPLLICGWSLGGLLALRLAAKGAADGLVLISSTARFTRSKEETAYGWEDIFIRKMITGIGKDRQSVETKFRQLMFTEEEWNAELGECLPPSGNWTSQALVAGLQILRNEECLSQLKKISCPVFLVHGTEDRICPIGAVSELKAQLAQATLLAIPACGHAPFLGREEHIAGEIRRWWHAWQDKRLHSLPI